LVKLAKSVLFPWRRKCLGEVLVDHNLASLGDSYANLIYSLAISNKKGQPVGIKVKGSILSSALRRAGLRDELPSRMSTHSLADAAEALLVYAWLSDRIGLEESVQIITKEKDPSEGLVRLLKLIKERTTFP
jgi:hypothetical protein